MSHPGPVHGGERGENGLQQGPDLPGIRYKSSRGPVPRQPGTNHEIRTPHKRFGRKTKRKEHRVGMPLALNPSTVVQRDARIERANRIPLILGGVIQPEDPQAPASFHGEDFIVPSFHRGRNKSNGFAQSLADFILQFTTAWGDGGDFAPSSNPSLERFHRRTRRGQ